MRNDKEENSMNELPEIPEEGKKAMGIIGGLEPEH